MGTLAVDRAALASESGETIRFGGFVCRADFPLDRGLLVRRELEQLESEVTAILELAPRRKPIELYLFRDEASYRRHLGRHYPKFAERRALYVESGGAAKIFAYQNPEFGVDLRHETTHALLHAALPAVPLWLDEGLAEYFELPPEKRPGDGRYVGAIQANLRDGLVPRLAALEQIDDPDQMGPDEYRDAWAWVHFLLHGPNAAYRELRGYVDDLKKGSSWNSGDDLGGPDCLQSGSQSDKRHRASLGASCACGTPIDEQSGPPPRFPQNSTKNLKKDDPRDALSVRLGRAMPQLEQQFAAHFRHGEQLREPSRRPADTGVSPVLTKSQGKMSVPPVESSRTDH